MKKQMLAIRLTLLLLLSPALISAAAGGWQYYAGHPGYPGYAHVGGQTFAGSHTSYSDAHTYTGRHTSYTPGQTFTGTGTFSYSSPGFSSSTKSTSFTPAGGAQRSITKNVTKFGKHKLVTKYMQNPDGTVKTERHYDDVLLHEEGPVSVIGDTLFVSGREVNTRTGRFK